MLNGTISVLELTKHRVIAEVTSYKSGQHLPVERVNRYVTDGEVSVASLTAVRSKSEQFQLVAAFGIVGLVGRRRNRRLDRHFLEYCDRKDL